MLSSRGCHTVKSILRENPCKLVWLFSLSYMKVHRQRQRETTAVEDEGSDGRRRGQRTTTTTTLDDDDGWPGQRTTRTAVDDDGGRRETAIKPYKFHILLPICHINILNFHVWYVVQLYVKFHVK